MLGLFEKTIWPLAVAGSAAPAGVEFVECGGGPRRQASQAAEKNLPK